MSKVTTARHAPKPRPSHLECCVEAECTSGLRNRYFPGKRLTPDAFSIEQDYALARRRLLNRAVHGWGVVYGFAVAMATAQAWKHDRGALYIGAGLALDEPGRELAQVEGKTVGLNDVILLEGGRPIYTHRREDAKAREAYFEGKGGDACWLLRAHYAEQLIGQMKLSDPCSCDRVEWDRVCETVRYTLERVDCEACCQDFGCELECECPSGPCCEEHGRPTRVPEELLRWAKQAAGYISQADQEMLMRLAQERPEALRDAFEKLLSKIPPEAREKLGPLPHFEPHAGHKTSTRGGCRCLCEHLTQLDPGTECENLCEIEEPCARVRVDLHNGVPLACVKLHEGECGWAFESVYDDCGPRRLVKRNDLLFDLIRGCDLTRISRIGWARFHRKLVDWDDFMNAFGPRVPDVDDPPPNVTVDFWIEFSRPVLRETVDRDCFSMTIVGVDEDTGWGEPHRVPIVDIETTSAPRDTSGRFVTRVKLVVEGAWLRESIQSRRSIFDQDDTLVEIKVHGHYMVDCNGQMLAAAGGRGLAPESAAEGGPGHTFFSSFRVRRPPARPAQTRTRDQRNQGVTS